MNEIFTVGHSNRSLSELLSILECHNIQLLVDVRGGKAWSGTFPYFNTENLAIQLPKNGFEYMRLPELGGRRGKQDVDPLLNNEWRIPAFKNYADHAYTSEEFDASIDELIALSKQKRVAYMCSEAVPWRCHRSIITDYLILLHSMKVVHLLGKQQMLEGTPHDFAFVYNKKVIYPKNKLKFQQNEEVFIYEDSQNETDTNF